MKVNKENYESLLIDYLDGILDPLLAEDLLAYIGQDPVLQAELDVLRKQQVNVAEETSGEKPDFSFLKKPVTKVLDDELVELMIGAVEQDLTDVQQNTLERKLVLYPELNHDFDLFKKTKLQAERSVVVENKEGLKKRGGAKQIPLFRSWISAAAVLLFISLASVLYYQTLQQPETKNTAAVMMKQQMQVVKPEGLAVAKAPANTEVEEGREKAMEEQHKSAIKNKMMIQQMPAMASKPEIAAISAKQAQTLELRDLKDEVIGVPTPKYRHPIQPEELAANDQFLTPKAWLLSKIKKAAHQSDPLTDTLFNGGVKGAEAVAVRLLNKTGISYSDKKTEDGTNAGFAIISRYFAFERSTHNNN